MITGLLLFLAASAAPSKPPPVGLMSSDDYPKSALDRGEEGATAIRVLVSPDGGVDDCAIDISSGYKDLDETTCAIVRKRAVFSPALGADSKPIYSVFRTQITWSIGAPKIFPVQPDVELTVNQAPADTAMPLIVTVSYTSKPDGSISRCHLVDTSPPRPQVLVDLACQALSNLSGEIIHNHKGEAVVATNITIMRFSVKR